MEIQDEDFPELNAFIKIQRQRRIAGFVLFFCILAMSLGGGNLFFEYTQALQSSDENKIEIKVIQKVPLEIYQPLFATFQEEHEKVIMRAVMDSIPKNEKVIRPSPPPKPAAEKKIGVYLHMNNTANPKALDLEIEELKGFENSALVFDVKGSYVYFPANSEIAKKYGLIKPLYDLPEIIEKLKSEGIYTIARVISIKDGVFANENPEVKLWNKTKTGFATEWVDPANLEVLDYNREVIYEILTAGIDEINLDFIRYPTKFTSEFLGITGEEKIQNVSNFVKMVRMAIDSKKPNTILSVNTFAILGWDHEENSKALGQDIIEIAELADIIAPMLYPNTFSNGNPNYYLEGESFEYSTVYQTLKKYEELLGEDSKKLRPWIQGYYTTNKNMVDQVEAVYDAGFCGFTIWDIFNNYKASYYALEEVEVPEKCLIAS